MSLATRTWANKNVIKSTMWQVIGAHVFVRNDISFTNSIAMFDRSYSSRVRRIRNEFHKSSSFTRLDLFFFCLNRRIWYNTQCQTVIWFEFGVYVNDLRGTTTDNMSFPVHSCAQCVWFDFHRQKRHICVI